MEDMGNNCHGLQWNHIQLPRDVDCGHHQATIAACDILGLRPDEKVMMLQVTQPYRRDGLLDDVDARIGDKTVITATRVLTDGRLLTTDGRKDKMMDKPYIDLLDGAVYGGRCRDVANWWTMERPSDIVINRTIGVCDIDTPDDLMRCVRWI